MSLWQPLLSASQAEQALGLAEEIAHALEALSRDRQQLAADPVSLANGMPGSILFFAYLDQARPEGGWGDLAVEVFETAIDEMAGLPADPGLYAGFTGMAWVHEHLQDWFLDGSDDTGADIAAAVEKALSVPWSDYDLIQGLVGMGVYALERLPRPGAERCLRRVVARLSELAELQAGTAAWRIPADLVPPDRRDWFPQGFFFTGVAHGAAGVISLLSAAHAAGVEARPLLDAAVRWLLAQRLPPGAGSAFSYETAPEVVPGAPFPRPTRLAWCHGDPGISAALLGAARRAGEPAWEREALGLARAAAARSGSEKSIADAGLCHGSGGLLHLFNRMYQATGDPALGDAARFWFDRTLALRRPGEGVAGFLSWEIDAQGNSGGLAAPGFLTGAAGIGLALLAAATPVEPAWDRVLLTSIPPRQEADRPCPPQAS